MTTRLLLIMILALAAASAAAMAARPVEPLRTCAHATASVAVRSVPEIASAQPTASALRTRDRRSAFP